MRLEVRLAPWVEGLLRYATAEMPESAFWEVLAVVGGEGIEVRMVSDDAVMTFGGWRRLRLPAEHVRDFVFGLHSDLDTSI